MLRLRPFKKQDAKYIISWIRDERAFRKWSADRYEDYPIQVQDMIDMYESKEDTDNYYPMTAFDESGIVGHLMLRYTDEEKQNIRFCFVIVDYTKRNMGYGKKILQLAKKYAFEFLGAEKISLGVFENNPSAISCYESVGFKAIPTEKYFFVLDEKWKCIEMELNR